MSLVIYEMHEGVAKIRLNRPQAHNALDEAMNVELAAAWSRFAEDETAKIAIISGEGESFCAGADLKSFIPKWAEASFGTLRQNVTQGIAGGITRGGHRLYKPIIAALHGFVVGGGFELALACDIRVAANSATFGVFEVRKGLHQGDGGLTRLIAIAGVGVALDLALTGREVSAPEALQLRLVNRVVPPDEVMATAEAIARQIASNAEPAIRSVKETVFELIGRPLDDALRLEALYGYSSFGSGAELRERIGLRIR